MGGAPVGVIARPRRAEMIAVADARVSYRQTERRQSAVDLLPHRQTRVQPCTHDGFDRRQAAPALGHLLDLVDHAGDAVEAALVVHRDGNQHPLTGVQRVHRQQPEVRGAVDVDDVKVVELIAQRLREDLLAVVSIGHALLGLLQPLTRRPDYTYAFHAADQRRSVDIDALSALHQRHHVSLHERLKVLRPGEPPRQREPRVHIDDQHPQASLSVSHRQVRHRRRLRNAALAVRHRVHPSHQLLSPAR